MDIICDELKRNNIDFDKETLPYHINVILNKNHEIYETATAGSLAVLKP
jgi:predicted transcriptional regulator